MTGQQHFLTFSDAYIDKEFLYAHDYESNLFFRAGRKHKYQIEKLGSLNGFCHEEANRICAVLPYKNFLFLFSSYTYEIARYDMETGKFSYFFPRENNVVFRKVRAVCRVGNTAWIFRDAFETVCCIFSMENCGYEFIDLDVSGLIETTRLRKVRWIGKETVCLADNKIWRCIPGTNCIFTIDTMTREVEIHRLPLEIELFAIGQAEGDLCMLSVSGEDFVRWNRKSGVTDRKRVNYEDKIDRPFKLILHFAEWYILIPCMAEKIYFLSESGQETEQLSLPKQFKKIYKRGLFLNYEREGNRLILFPNAGTGLIEIDLDTKETQYYPLGIPKEDYMNGRITEGYSIQEKEQGDLETYLSLVCSDRYTDSGMRTMDKTVGAGIVQKLKEIV